MVTLALLVLVLRRTAQFRALFRDRRVFLLLSLAAVVITINWGTYIYGVTNDRVVETSLGYFMNPLVTVLMGVLLLGRAAAPPPVAGDGAWARSPAVVLTVDYGHPPWIALVLAFSFGTYGLAKKQAGAEAVESLTLETYALAPLALGVPGLARRAGRLDVRRSKVSATPLLLMSGGTRHGRAVALSSAPPPSGCRW